MKAQKPIKKAASVRHCDACGKTFDSKCPECRRRYREACGRSREGHHYAMIYNDGETCLRCGHHREINERSVEDE
jgi:hypothetical protein